MNRGVPNLGVQKAVPALDDPEASAPRLSSAKLASPPPVSKLSHGRIRSADYASTPPAYRMPPEMGQGSLRKISEANEADLDISPRSPPSGYLGFGAPPRK